MSANRQRATLSTHLRFTLIDVLLGWAGHLVLVGSHLRLSRLILLTRYTLMLEWAVADHDLAMAKKAQLKIAELADAARFQ